MGKKKKYNEEKKSKFGCGTILFFIVAILISLFSDNENSENLSNDVKPEQKVIEEPVKEAPKEENAVAVAPVAAPVPKKEVPKSCPKNIKGNISSSGEKIFHVPGGDFYDTTVAEQTFCTKAEARAAGYRESKR